MVTNYELILKMEKHGEYLQAIRRGIMPIVVMDYRLYYEKYIQERKGVSKMQAITNVSEEYGVSESTVKRAVRFMKMS
jgi:DNA-directed RNA polymerase specialized sigma54-like protein